MQSYWAEWFFLSFYPSQRPSFLLIVCNIVLRKGRLVEISISGLTKKYGSLKALDSVSMNIEPGKIVALLGTNGAGKTTLLRMLAGVVGASKGHIYYDGNKFTRNDVPARQRVMFLADFPLAYANMNALQHIGMVMKLYGKPVEGIEDKITAVFKDLDILPLVRIPLSTLSRGQLYKVMLTTLVAVNPELWLIDEPFASGMDPIGISCFKRYARAAAAAGRTILYTTQILEAAEGLCDSVCIIDKGLVRFTATSDELRKKAEAGDPVVAQLLDQLRDQDE